jgi:hypothetical protein
MLSDEIKQTIKLRLCEEINFNGDGYDNMNDVIDTIDFSEVIKLEKENEKLKRMEFKKRRKLLLDILYTSNKTCKK